MPQNGTKFSSIFLSIGVLLITLVVGTTYAAYQRDVDLLKIEETNTFAPFINRLFSKTIHLERELRAFSGSGPQEEKALLLQTMGSIKGELSELSDASHDFMDLPEDGAQIMQRLGGFIDSVEPAIHSSDMPLTKEVLSQSSDLFRRLGDYFSALIVDEISIGDNIRSSIKSGAKSSLILSFLTVLLSIIGMAHFVRLSSQNEQMANRNMKLAKRSEAESKAKSRLLTMLSHEIRTPMNGVLGLVSLGLHQKISEGQRNLLEQVQGSAMELVTFLEDMLDFSSLEKNDADDKISYLFKESTVMQVVTRLDPLMNAYGKRLKMGCDGTVPSVLKGDITRIPQVLFYVINHLAKNTSQSEISGVCTVHQDFWLWKFDLTINDNEQEKSQVLALLGDTQEDAFIASDTIEATMARGLLDVLGGEMKFVQSAVDKGQSRLLIYIPIKPIRSSSSLKIHINANINSLPKVERLLESIEHEIVEDDNLREAQIVFCEGGSVTELKRLTDIRKESPMAQLVCMGTTQFEELYDQVIEDSCCAAQQNVGDKENRVF